MSSTALRRFWFEFDVSDLSGDARADFPSFRGCGVTGYDEADCLDLIRQTLFDGEQLPAILNATPDVSIDDLDAEHVLPNMGVVTWRGIWYPALNTGGPPRD